MTTCGRRGLIAAVAAAALVGGLASPAYSQGDAGSSASVGGAGQAPRIECGWALNDVDHDWNNGMQYGNDDDSPTNPGQPCRATVAGEPSGEATMANNVLTPMISVRPNAHDYPTQAYVELWGAVTSSAQTPNVYWDVFHSGAANNGTGSFKVQVDGTKYADSSAPDRCEGPTSSNGVNMFAAADGTVASQSTLQLSSQARTNIINECKFQQKKLFYGAFAISKHQPYGLYRIVMTASNPGGLSSSLTYYINVLPFVNLEKDFAGVTFDALPNSHAWQNGNGGDLIWDTGAGNTATSVRNTGNQGAQIAVAFTHMCLSTAQVGASGCTDNKRIDHFDAKFGAALSTLQTIGDTYATAITSNLASDVNPPVFGAPVSFDDTRARTLCPNDIGKIEFSVWTDNIGAGIYNGLIRVIGSANLQKRCATDNGEPYPLNNTGTHAAPATPHVTGYWPLGAGS